MKFIFSKNTEVEVNGNYYNTAVDKAVEILKRDMKAVFVNSSCRKSKIIIYYDSNTDIDGEEYHILFSNEHNMIINAKGILGAVYAILFLSKEFLKIPEFWYWMDWNYQKKEYEEIEIKDYISPKYEVSYRGWFINDEVLLTGLNSAEKSRELFKMAFEACLRCGGNMIIPGTDQNNKKYMKLAASMGLAITHHHAEPLGAEMFARAYPEMEASYFKYPDKYKELWNKAVKEQSKYKVIWGLGFRGQGDKAFWEDDNKIYSDKEKGDLISEVINEQYKIVCNKVKNPIFSTNMYGEITDLYQKGYLKLPAEVIKVWADNGYGKMVSRRQGNRNPRVESIPLNGDKGPQGIYYHVSFFDLQASNHLTMQPNSNEFIGRELEKIIKNKMTKYWIINCGSIKPHIYYLDLISNYWQSGKVDVNEHCINFASKYFGKYANDVSKCICAFGKTTIQYGKLEDEHAGEQFYHHTTRLLANKWLKGEIIDSVERLLWLTGDIGYQKQMEFFYHKCLEVLPRYKKLRELCREAKASMGGAIKKRFQDFIELQVILHESGLEGSIKFCESFFAYSEGNIIKAFMDSSTAKDNFAVAVKAMKEAEHGKWKGFYENDCLTNVGLTVEIMTSLRAYLRIIGDGPNFYGWERKYLMTEEDKRVVLLMTSKKHLSDEQLAKALKDKF